MRIRLFDVDPDPNVMRIGLFDLHRESNANFNADPDHDSTPWFNHR
jgi:hypothetical protein